ncbi:FKBP-type peptidyl-prolyl cis-trans isomerase [Streptomyces sp. NPDC001709]
MRRITSYSSFLALSILLLAGCSGHESAPAAQSTHRPLPVPAVPVQHRLPVPDPVGSDTALPRVSGEFGHKAEIAIPKKKPSGRFVVTPVHEGKGRKAENGDVVIVNYTAKTWKHGTSVPGTYGKAAGPKVFPVGRDAVIPALDRSVLGQRAGSRVLVVAPPEAAYGATGNARLGVSATDTVVFAVDIMKIVPARLAAEGHQAETPDALPRVAAGPGPAPITVPDTAAPKHLVDKTLVRGSGALVKAGQSIVIQYSGAVWETNRGKDQATLFDSSWAAHSPTTVVIGRGNVIEGWDRALVGARVGSRVLLVVPPGLGYGSSDRKGVPARSTLVYVVDVLAAA